MAQTQTAVLKLYHSVIEDVISGVRDSFLDEGVDEQILQELKQTWESKLVSSKAVEPIVTPPEPQPPQIGQKQTNAANKSGGANSKKVSTSTALAQTEPGHMMNQLGSFPQHQPANQLVHQQQQQQQQQQSTHPQQTTAAQQQQQQQQSVSAGLLAADPNKQVPIQITLPAQASSGESQPRILTIQVPASALQGNQLHTVLTGPVISATMALPQHLACSLLQQHVNAVLQGQAASAGVMQQQQPVAATTTATDASRHQLGAIRQLDGTDDELLSRLIGQVDGPHDSSDDDDDDDDDDEDLDDDDNDEKEEDENEEENDGGPEEEPLNSGDDVSDEDPTDLFDTDNVVVCQYDKITRSRNKWKFYLKDGIMNLNGKDYVFQKANGDAEW